MKKKILLTIMLFLGFVVFGTALINIYMINSTKNHIIEINDLEKINNVDAILVLGCKAYADGPSLMLAKRLEKGVEIYNKLHTKIILSGDHGQKNYDEVNVMRDYMLDANISSKNLFLDHAGFNTYDSIYRAKNVFGAKKVIIVTQKYHLYRALYLAKSLNLEAYGIVASDIPQKSIMIKNEIREILSRDKNFFKGIFKPKSRYVGESISLQEDGNVTQG